MITHQPEERNYWGSPERLLGCMFRGFSNISYLVWGHVVPDIPDFCRELVAALAEE